MKNTFQKFLGNSSGSYPMWNNIREHTQNEQHQNEQDLADLAACATD